MIRYKTKIWLSHFRNFFRSSSLKTKTKETRFVFGLGSGRSGTSSLAQLLNLQDDYTMSHEVRPILAWNCDKKLLYKKLNQLAAKSQTRVTGDVASSYLPFVEEIIGLFPQTKFVCIKRDMHETIKSFMTKSGNRNHWSKHDGSQWKKDYWDRFFPKYNIDDKQEAIKKYWIDYYERSENLSSQYPDNFRVLSIRVLSDDEQQKDLFEFLNIENPISENIHANSKQT